MTPPMTAQPPLDEIVRRIVGAFHPRRIVMFGSRARGDAKPDSDVDLFLEMDTDLRPIDRIRAVDQLFGLRAWSMDVIVYTPREVVEQRAYRNSIVRRVESEGRVLYEQS